MNIFLITITIALIIWITGTLLVIRDIEGPKYVVIEQKDGYEMREYESYIVAEVEVEGDMRTAMNSGFRQLAGYIFGGNTSKSQVAMTVPVMDTTKAYLYDKSCHGKGIKFRKTYRCIHDAE